MQQEIQHKEIRGITIRQLIAVIVAVAITTGIYFDLRNNIRTTQDISFNNSILLKENQVEIKEQTKQNNARLSVLEETVKINAIRIKLIEDNLKK